MAYEALYLMLEEELDLKWALAQQEQQRCEAHERRVKLAWLGACSAVCIGLWSAVIALAIHYWPRMAHAWGWRW